MPWLLSWAFDLTPSGIKRTDDLDAAKAPPFALPPKLPPPEKSIAVLPFENFSDDQQNTYFADGIQDDILSSLAKLADLKVISRTSVRQYRGGTRNLREIGEALGVAYIMEGTVRREANRVRINTQLIDARTDCTSGATPSIVRSPICLRSRGNWPGGLRSRCEPIFPRRKRPASRFIRRATSTLMICFSAPVIFSAGAAMAIRAKTGSAACVFSTKRLRGIHEFALAHCLASRFHGELYWFGYDRTRSRLTQAKLAADTALQLQPDSGDVRLALAYYYYYGYLDYDLARTELAIAHEAAPNDAEVWDAAGAVDRRQGRWQHALANFEKAKELDPRNGSVLWNVAETHASLGHDDARRSAGSPSASKLTRMRICSRWPALLLP